MRWATSIVFFFTLIPLVSSAQNKNFITNEIAKMEQKRHQQFAIGEIQNEADPTYDVHHYALDFEVNPAIRAIKGTSTISAHILESNTGQLIVDLHDSLTVDSVIAEGEPLAFTHANNQIVIQLPLELRKPEVRFTVHYQGVPPQKDKRSFTTYTHNGVPVLWTLSQPYGALDWWPCKQSLNDKADSIKISITCPREYVAVANGNLVSELPLGLFTKYTYQHKQPIVPYLVAIAVTNYDYYEIEAELTSGNIRVPNWLYPEDLERFKSRIDITVDLLHLFDSLLIPYPFPDYGYGHVQFSWGGGMEHQTRSFMGNFHFELIAHELAHQWFGDYITCGTWKDIWLNEGFATYFNGLPYETFFDGIYWRIWKRLQVERIVSEPDGSVTVFDTSDVSRLFDSRLTYQKGGMVLHMLRTILGKADFFQALREYLLDDELAFGFSRTDQLFYHFENVSGKNLDDFRENWLVNEGHPSYEISWTQGDDRAKFTFIQSTSHPSVNFFALPVHIRVKSSQDDSLDFIFENSYNGEVFGVEIPFEIDEVLIDPDYDIISANNTAFRKDYRNELRTYPNPVAHSLFIELDDPVEYIKGIRLVNQVGQLTEITSNEKDYNSRILDITNYPSGAYIFEVTTNKKVFYRKILKL
jgi:aminopeptidase N